MNVPKAYEEFVNFIVSGIQPEAVIAYQPMPETSDRVETLVFKSKANGLTDAEQSELDHFLQIEHIMRLAKARAHQLLKA